MEKSPTLFYSVIRIVKIPVKTIAETGFKRFQRSVKEETKLFRFILNHE